MFVDQKEIRGDMIILGDNTGYNIVGFGTIKRRVMH